jgi:hypothetical protein
MNYLYAMTLINLAIQLNLAYLQGLAIKRSPQDLRRSSIARWGGSRGWHAQHIQ